MLKVTLWAVIWMLSVAFSMAKRRAYLLAHVAGWVLANLGIPGVFDSSQKELRVDTVS